MVAKNGSSLLIIFMISTFLSLFAFGYWYKTSLLVDLVNQREIYYKNFYLTEKILNYGIDVAKKNFLQFANADSKKLPVVLDAQFLLNYVKGNQDLANPDLANPDLEAEVLINKVIEKEKLILKAFLKNKSSKKILCELSCKLAITEVFNEESKEKQIYFIVQNFSIGNSI